MLSIPDGKEQRSLSYAEGAHQGRCQLWLVM